MPDAEAPVLRKHLQKQGLRFFSWFYKSTNSPRFFALYIYPESPDYLIEV